MQFAPKLVACSLIVAWPFGLAQAQNLAPRAYVIAPIHTNALTLTYSFTDGGIFLNGAVPATNTSGRIYTSVFTYFHTLSVFGRSANVTASLPYGVGNFRGTIMSSETTVHRSGMVGVGIRFSVNLLGGPAMNLKHFREWRQKTILGVSLSVIPPTGQYDPTKLINFGVNRWAFKPELGYSRRWHSWLLDGYAGVWLFTKNSDYFSRNQFVTGTNTQSQRPIASFEGHLSYDFKQRLWASLDSNLWVGGRTSINDVKNTKTLQENSRIGTTLSVPVPKSKHQSLKFSYSRGAYVRFGGDFQVTSVAWQYTWLGRPN
jgi:hypothetical protein